MHQKTIQAQLEERRGWGGRIELVTITRMWTILTIS